MVIWVIGLAGSGKTTVATMLCDAFSGLEKASVLLDGDNVREVFVTISDLPSVIG